MTELPEFEFDIDKNNLLKKERGISFEEIIVLIDEGHRLFIQVGRRQGTIYSIGRRKHEGEENMKTKKSDSEKEILEALGNNNLIRSKNALLEIENAREAAASYLKKNARINLRLSEPDLKRLKRRAAEEGLPYQTFIASILHRFVTGRLTIVS